MSGCLPEDIMAARVKTVLPLSPSCFVPPSLPFLIHSSNIH